MRGVYRIIVALAALLLAAPTTLAKESANGSQYWELEYIVASVIYDGRPAGLLTVVPVVDMGSNRALEDVAIKRLEVQDHFLIGLNQYATSGFDPRGVININQIKRILQAQLDSVIGPNRGVVYVISAHMAKRKGF